MILECKQPRNLYLESTNQDLGILHGSMQPRHNSSRGQDLKSTRASMRAYNLNNGGNSNFVARACFTAITGNEVLNLECGI